MNAVKRIMGYHKGEGWWLLLLLQVLGACIIMLMVDLGSVNSPTKPRTIEMIAAGLVGFVSARAVWFVFYKK